MSKLIVEMEMPRCCDECDANYDCVACGISGALWHHNPKYKGFDPSKERLPDCPIKGVLPDEHGDLIDRDVSIQTFKCIEDAPFSGFDGQEAFYSPEDVVNTLLCQDVAIAAERKDNGTTTD